MRAETFLTAVGGIVLTAFTAAAESLSITAASPGVGAGRDCSSGAVEDGCGTVAWPDGTKYVGKFRAGLFYGPGILTFSDGSKLEGDFENGGPDGEATFTFPNGAKLSGRYHGVLTDPRYSHPPLHLPFWRSFFGDEGIVRIIVTVDTNGAVMSAQLLNPSKYPSFNSAALDGLKSWRFLPPTIDETPVKGAHVMEVQFASAGF